MNDLSVDGGMCRNAVEIGRNTEVTAAAIVAVEKMAAEMVVIVTRMIIVAVIRRHVSETTDGWLKRESGRLNLEWEEVAKRRVEIMGSEKRWSSVEEWARSGGGGGRGRE